jgi:ABC-type glycerol-3-phosphate transport system substrate-binding protein
MNLIKKYLQQNLRFTQRTLYLLILCGFAPMLAGCGQTTSQGADAAPSEPLVGRYMEHTVQISENPDTAGVNLESSVLVLAADQEEVRLLTNRLLETVSVDQGISFQNGTALPDKIKGYMEQREVYQTIAASPRGTYAFTRKKNTGEYESMLLTSSGDLEVINGLPQNVMAYFYCGTDGRFYCVVNTSIYQVEEDGQEGDSLKVVLIHDKLTDSIDYLATNGEMLYVWNSQNGLTLLDAETGEWQHDEVLEDFLNEFTHSKTDAGTFPLLLYPMPDNGGVYAAVSKGLYHHVPGGNMIEQMMDGTLTYMSREDTDFRDIEVLADSFLILYGDGSLRRYAYDTEVTTQPETTLTIYSLYEDYNLALAIAAFRNLHPDIYVTYEIAVTSGNGVTPQDALQNLSKDISGQSGPDVFMTDGLSYENYMEKGVFLDLAPYFQEWITENYFYHVTDLFWEEDALYTLPMVFELPVLVGPGDALHGVESLADLADLAEDARSTQPRYPILNVRDAADALELLSISSSGAWQRPDGTLDREAVTVFLTDVKRIYEAQMAGMRPEDYPITDYQAGNYDLPAMDAATYALESIQYGFPYFGGVLNPSLMTFPAFQGMINAEEDEYISFPGQVPGSCIPVSKLAVNQASKEKELAVEFVHFALSAQFQKDALLNGVPINKTAYEHWQEFPERYRSLGVGVHDLLNQPVVTDNLTGVTHQIPVYWPSKAEFGKLTALINQVSALNLCDARIYEAVITYGQKALRDELTISNAVEAMEQEVLLYLAE